MISDATDSLPSILIIALFSPTCMTSTWTFLGTTYGTHRFKWMVTTTIMLLVHARSYLDSFERSSLLVIRNTLSTIASRYFGKWCLFLFPFTNHCFVSLPYMSPRFNNCLERQLLNGSLHPRRRAPLHSPSFNHFLGILCSLVLCSFALV